MTHAGYNGCERLRSELVDEGIVCSDGRSDVFGSSQREDRSDRPTKLSHSQHRSFLEGLQLASTILLDMVYDIFGFGLPHNLHLRISKLLNECTFTHLSSDGVTTHRG